MNRLSGASGIASPIQWMDDWLLGHDGMDACHKEFATLLAHLQSADDEDLVSVFDRFIKHLREHFDAEDVMMLRTNFPPRQCHMDEHAAVMKSVFEVRQQLAAGNRPLVRRLANELAAWFPAHTQYMDSALAHWVNKTRLGGKTLVLKRGVASSLDWGDQSYLK